MEQISTSDKILIAIGRYRCDGKICINLLSWVYWNLDLNYVFVPIVSMCDVKVAVYTIYSIYYPQHFYKIHRDW